MGNFTSHWRDGVALSALVEHLKPGSCPNYKNLNRSQQLANCQDAMGIAERELGIPMLLTPEDMVNPEVDELSVMTYVSYFCGVNSPGAESLLKWVNSMIPDYGITNFTSDWRDGRALCALVDALAPGLCPDHKQLDASRALDNVKRGMQLGESKLRIKPTLTPEEFADPHLDQVSMMTYLSWFRSASPVHGAAQKCTVGGEGIAGGKVGVETEFRIKTGGDESIKASRIKATVYDPSGKAVKVKVRDSEDGVVSVKYTPVVPGTYTVVAFCDDEEISQSPFHPKFEIPPQASCCRVHGAGLSDAIVNEPTSFYFEEGKEAGCGEMMASVVDPSGKAIAVSVKDDGGDGSRKRIEYTPTEVGTYRVAVTWAGEDVPGGPFRVNVVDPKKCVCVGDGIERAVLNQPARFSVRTDGAGPGVLSAVAYGPTSRVPVEIVRDSDGAYLAEYRPTELGDYSLEVKWGGRLVGVDGAPHVVRCISGVDPSKVKVTRPPPSTKSGLYALGRPLEFKVNSEQAGAGKLTASAVNKLTGKAASVRVLKDKEGQYRVEVKPDERGEYNVDFRYDDLEIPGNPQALSVVDAPNAKKVKIIEGPNGTDLLLDQDAQFFVDTKDAGFGQLTATVQTTSGIGTENANVYVKRMEDGKFAVGMSANEADDYYLNIWWDDQPVESSPIVVRFREPPDAAKVKVNASSSLPRKMFVGRPFQFDVDTSRAGSGRLTARSVRRRTGQRQNVDVVDVGYGRHVVKFDPNVADDYELELVWGDETVPGKPVEVKYLEPPDASKVKCKTLLKPDEEAIVGERKSLVFDTLFAGTGKLSAYVHSEEHGPLDVVEVEEATDVRGEYKVSFTPRHPDEYVVDVFWDGVPVPCSPVAIKAIQPSNPNRVKLIGAGAPSKPVRVGQAVRMTFDTSEAGRGQLTTVATGRKTGPVPVQVREILDGRYEVVFTPECEDKFNVMVQWNGEPIPGAPFAVKVEASTSDVADSSKVKIASASPRDGDFRVGQSAEIVLDARDAGDGVPSVHVTGTRTGATSAEVFDVGNGQYMATFTPDKADRYTIELFWDDEEIEASPIAMKCLPRKSDLSKIRVSELEPGVVLQPVKFYVNTGEAGDGELLVRTRGPTNGSTPDFVFESAGDGLYEANYVPNAPGVHDFDVTWSGEPIPGSPFRVNVMGNSDASRVTVSGRALENDDDFLIGEPAELDVDASRAPRGKLTGHAVGTKDYMPQHVEITDLDNGQYAVRFTANEPDTYMLCLKYNGENVLGSPFKLKYVQPPDPSLVEIQGLRNGIVFEPIRFRVDARRAGSGELLVRAAGPTAGGPSDFDLRNTGNGLFVAVYVPTAAGDHSFHVTWSGIHIPGSPFKVNVAAGREGKAKMIEAAEVPDSKVEAGTPVEVVVNTRKGGKGGKLTASCRGLHVGVVHVKVETNRRNGTSIVRFVPPQVDDYTLDVLWDGKHIRDSPFHVHAYGSGKTLRQNTIGVTASHCSVLEPRVSEDNPFFSVGQPVRYVVQTPGVPARHVVAIATGPKGNCPTTVQNVGNGSFAVDVVPPSPGTYRLVFKVFDKPLPRCPFLFVAGQPQYNPSKVVVTGDGIDNQAFRLGATCNLDVDARRAGTGRLLVDASGPITDSKELEVIDNEDGSYVVRFKPVRPGEYQLDVVWVDKPVPGSPFQFRFFRGSVSVDAKSLRAEGVGLSKADVGEKAEFVVRGLDGAADESNLEATCHGVKAIARVFIDSVSDGVARGHYIVPTAGAYLLCLRWAGEHIEGSPFKVTAGQAGATSRVRVASRTMDPVTNSAVDFRIDVSGAGQGQLGMKIQGPGSPQGRVIDVGGGMLLASFVPADVGKYTVSLKWLGKHVEGSPFKLKVTSPPRPEKVRCAGSGLESGFVGMPSVFTVDTSRAGGGMLSVKAQGPKAGPFKIHMEKSPENDRHVLVYYNPTEGGKYVINVKWSDQHVPGSPFVVYIQPQPIDV